MPSISLQVMFATPMKTVLPAIVLFAVASEYTQATPPVLSLTQAALQKIDADIKPDHYDIARADLDGDGKEDVLALMNGKSGYCGSGGCTLFILKATEEGFASIGSVKVVSRPVYLRKSISNGHRDLLVSVRGGGASPGLAALAFDGSGYPVSPGEANARKQDDDTVLFAADSAVFVATQELQGMTFKVTSSGGTVTITPSGLEIDNSPVTVAVKDVVNRAEAGDINADGSPEIYIYAAETTGEMRASLIAFGTNRKKSMTPIYLPPLEDDAKNAKGYRGHDEFAVVEGIIARRFPIFPEDASKTEPTGRMRQLQYKLVAGEAGWILKLDKDIEF
jgi:hypothetical protein